MGQARVRSRRVHRALPSFRAFVAFLLAATALTVGPSAAHAQQNSKPEAAQPGPFSADLARVESAATAIQNEGRTRFPQIYGGLELTANASRIRLYQTQNDASSLADAQAVAEGVPIDVQLTPRSEAKVLAAQGQVSAALPQLARDGVDVVFHFPNPATGQEEVWISNAKVPQSSTIQALGNAVAFEPHPGIKARAATSRISDAPPWNAGDFISGTSGGTCTSGLPTHNGAQGYMVTASHCFPPNTSIYNYSAFLPLGSATPSTYLGAVSSSDLTPRGLDAEVIPTSASSFSFVGSTSSTTKVRFSGYTNDFAGTPFCISGAFEGESCAGVVFHPNGCVTFAYDILGGTVRESCHESYFFTVPSYQQFAGQGDSGSPIYQYVLGKLTALGIYSALDQNFQTTCTNWASAPPRACSSNGWFTEIAPILSKLTLTLNN